MTEQITDDVAITWAAYHASQIRNKDFEVTVSALLPLLPDQAHSVATIKHVIDKVRDTVAFLNPGQVPVLTADQPLYSLAKQIQWTWPENYGESKYVIMFGGLHIEMTAFKMVGNLLKDSGWSNVLTEGETASSGTSESFVLASSVTRTRQAHQITAAALYHLLTSAYDEYDNHEISFEDWCEQQRKEHPQFYYWHMILQIELTIFAFITPWFHIPG